MTHFKPIMVDEELCKELRISFPDLSYNKAVSLLLRIFRNSNLQYASPEKSLIAKADDEENISIFDELKTNDEVQKCQDK